MSFVSRQLPIAALINEFGYLADAPRKGIADDLVGLLVSSRSDAMRPAITSVRIPRWPRS